MTAINMKWLRQAQHRVNEDPAFRKLGSVDAIVAVRVGSQAYLVTFRAFRCENIRKIALDQMRDADFTLHMAQNSWQRFLTDRAAGSGATLAELDLREPLVHASSPQGKLKFLRYHTSLQAFFDSPLST